MMKNITKFIIFFLFSSIAFANEKDDFDKSKAKYIALQVVQSIFITPDITTAKNLISEKAEWKNHGIGSALEVLDEIKNEPGDFRNMDIQKIVFFSIETLESAKGEYPNKRIQMWKKDRIIKRLNSNTLGCLILWKNMKNKDELNLEVNAFIVALKPEGYKVVYFDDLP